MYREKLKKNFVGMANSDRHLLEENRSDKKENQESLTTSQDLPKYNISMLQINRILSDTNMKLISNKKDRKSSEDNIPTDKEEDHLSARLIFESSALHNNSSLR